VKQIAASTVAERGRLLVDALLLTAAGIEPPDFDKLAGEVAELDPPIDYNEPWYAG
jgi:hypothetical protein